MLCEAGDVNNAYIWLLIAVTMASGTLGAIFATLGILTQNDSGTPQSDTASRSERSGPRPAWASQRGEGLRGTVQIVDGLGFPEAYRVDSEGLDDSRRIRNGDAGSRSPEEDLEYARRRAG